MSYRASIVIPPYIQRGTIAITVSGGTPTTGTATITAVDPSYSAVRWLGQSSKDASNAPGEFATLVLTNATTVTASLFGATTSLVAMTVQYEVISWHPSVLRSVQPFSITMSEGGSTTGTATITAVTLNKSMVILGGYAANGSVSSSVASPAVQQIVNLTATTTVTATRATASGAGCIVHGTVVEFR